MIASGEEKQVISRVERWLLIRENAYARAQRRRFVGGDPVVDWLEAEEEIDKLYTTGFSGVLSSVDPPEIAKQIKRIFAPYGLHHLSVDDLLEKNQAAIDALRGVANLQIALAQDVLESAMSTLGSLIRGRSSTDLTTNQITLTAEAIEITLSKLRGMVEKPTESSTQGKKDASSES